jgi:hypothetical protein
LALSSREFRDARVTDSQPNALRVASFRSKREAKMGC